MTPSRLRRPRLICRRECRQMKFVADKAQDRRVEKPPISRLELVAMASNTGCTSDGEDW